MEKLFIFFENDIKKWNINGEKFIISFNKNKIEEKYFTDKLFNKNHFHIINKKLIKSKTIDIFDEISKLKSKISELDKKVNHKGMKIGMMDAREIIRIYLIQLEMEPDMLIKMMKKKYNADPLFTFFEISSLYQKNNIDESDLWINFDEKSY